MQAARHGNGRSMRHIGKPPEQAREPAPIKSSELRTPEGRARFLREVIACMRESHKHAWRVITEPDTDGT